MDRFRPCRNPGRTGRNPRHLCDGSGSVPHSPPLHRLWQQRSPGTVPIGRFLAVQLGLGVQAPVRRHFNLPDHGVDRR